jgi:hypothetical protein
MINYPYDKNQDLYYTDAAKTAWGIQKSSSDISLFSSMFLYDIQDKHWKIFEDNVKLKYSSLSTRCFVNKNLVINSGANAGNSSYVQSRRNPKYQPNRGYIFSTSGGFPNKNANGIRKIGVFNDNNGVYFKLKSDGNLYACILNDGIETHEELITLPSGIDIEKGNTYDIQFQWRGVGDYKFFVSYNDKITLVHKITLLNTLDSVSIQNPSLSARFECENITDEVSLWIGCVDISIEGGKKEDTHCLNINTPTTGVSVGSSLTNILLIKSEQLINGKINTIDALMKEISFSANDENNIQLIISDDDATFSGSILTNSNSLGNFKHSIGNDISFDTNGYYSEVFNLRSEIDINNIKKCDNFWVTPGTYLLLRMKTQGTGKVSHISVKLGEER